MQGLLGPGLLAMIASVAACAPSTFDNLTGGVEKGTDTPHARGDVVLDPTLAAPRPMSPISVSWVNTSRPRFRWAAGEGSTGAIVELSKTRDFKESRKLVGTGTELVLTEDLEPGFWFWRLRGRTEGSEGFKESAIWELLVRGPSARGASDVPNGGILDANGDGVPDLIAEFSEKGETETDPPVPGFALMMGNATGTYTPYSEQAVYFMQGSTGMRLTAGTDMDGDGFPDLVVADRWTNPKDSADSRVFVDIIHGGSAGTDNSKDQKQGALPMFFQDAIPVVHAAGDMNGDGWGDVVLSLPEMTFASLGSATGSHSMMVCAYEDPKVSAGALVAGFDLDGAGDGLADLAFASSRPTSPVRFAHGSRDRMAPAVDLTLGDLGAPTRATALAAGDFDGNGISDVAFVASFGGKPSVCIHTSGSGSLQPDHCWSAPGADVGFGISLAAGDLDADGIDELVVGSSTGVSIVKLDTAGKVVGEPFGEPAPGTYGAHVTMIHPGRPGPALWAVTGGDERSLHIVRGRTHQQKITADEYTLRLGPTLR